MTGHSGSNHNNSRHLSILFSSGVPPKTLPRNVFSPAPPHHAPTHTRYARCRHANLLQSQQFAP
ncbi:hypothetical protein HMPREF0573_11453 [Mobiluncus curtisii ATCC 43063]|uniref:Uncharacterized protein n=1 Tax=Mobiluncus curtisii (strain ATCC 43063 / DSM 2711 / V125) TaxID=548479 RepID=D6ZGL4_MOBCV|nr:hypothetical protein HMPREF0573_11453 [Mobiluncus curtisii ATCC 43063]